MGPGRASALRTAVAAPLAALAALAAAATPQAVAAQELTFEAAAARTLSRNERALAAEAVVSRAAAEQRAALGRHLPEVQLTARASRIDEAVAIDLDPLRQVLLQLHPQVPGAAVPPLVLPVQDATFARAAVVATVPLFAGGRLVAADRATGAAVRSARAQRARVQGELMTELAERYFGVRLAASARRTRERTLLTVARHVERARSLERHGQVARAERLRAEVALAEAQRESRQAARDEMVARLALASTLALESEPVPVTPLFAVSGAPALDSLLSVAAASNPALVQLGAELERARQSVRAAEGELAPSIGLFAQRELRTRDLTLLEPEWAVGISLALPLFTGGRRLAGVAAARAQARELEQRVERGRRDVRLLVERRHAELEEARSQLAALQATHALAEESLRAQQIAFEAGLATSLDVLDAEQALARVELGMERAKYDAIIAFVALCEAAGSADRVPMLITSQLEQAR